MEMDELLTVRARLLDELSPGTARIRRELEAVNDQIRKLNKAQAEAAREAKRKVDELNRSYSSLHRTLSSASSSANGLIFSLGKGIATAGAAASTGLTAWAVKSTSDIQQVRLSLDTFVGETMGAKLFGQLRELDKMSPFTFTELAGTTRQLTAFGVAAGKAYDLTASISSIASGTGRGAAGLEQLSLAVAQVKSAGRLTGDEARQLSEFFNVYDLIGQKYGGKSASEVKAAIESGATVPADIVLESIKNLEGPLSQFRGLNEKQLNTLAGQWAGFKSSMQSIVAGDGKDDGGVFGPLTQGLKNGETAAWTRDLGDALKEVGPPMSEAALAGLRFARGLLPIASPIVSNFFQGLANALNGARPGLSSFAADGPMLGESIGKAADQLGPMLPDLVELVGNLTVLGATVLPQVLTPILAVTGSLAQFANANDATRFAVGAAITAILGYKAISGVFGVITTATTLINGLATAQGRAATAGQLGGVGGIGIKGLAKLGLGGLGVAGLVAGWKNDNNAESAAESIGGGALLGGTIGSVVPGVGTALGAGIGAGFGAAAFGVKKLFGDPGGQLGASLAGHAAAEAASPGSRTITSGIRNWGLASSTSGHATGSSLDVSGSYMASYASNVRRFGGYAKQHDNGSGLHVHTDWGDTPTPATDRSQAQSVGGAPLIGQVIIYANDQIEFEAGIRKVLTQINKEKLLLA